MRKFIIFFLFFTILKGLYCERKVPEYVQKRVNIVASKIKPVLVKIYAIIPDFYQGREIKNEVSGSGAIIHPDGFIITNYHVAGKARYIRCTLSNGEKIDAYYYAGDPLTDIAIVKLKSNKKFPYAKFGNSSELKVGDWVIAAGSPYSLSQSITLGIVSNTKLVLPEFFFPFNKLEIDGENVGSMITWIGHDAPIYPGNSGGPLLNLDGEIVGVNEIKLGLSGAIPGNIARKIAEKLIKYREVERSWLGIEIQPLLQISEVKRGVLVSGVIENSPAEKSGILPGDIILKVGNKKVNVRTIEDIPSFNQIISGLPVNKQVKVVVYRKGRKKTFFLTPVKRENFYCEVKEIKRIGITGRNISFFESIELGKKDRKGVVVTSVSPGGPAGEAQPPLQKKDIITKINENEIKNVENLLSFLEGIRGETSLLVYFERKKKKMVTVLKIKERKESEIIPQVKKGWLPVCVEAITEETGKKLGIEETGVMITRTFTADKNFPLKCGDIITEIEGESLSVITPDDKEVFFEMLSDYPVGKEIEIGLLRNRKKIKVKVKLLKEPLKKDEVEKYQEPQIELTVRDLCFDDLQTIGMEKEGVIVDEVKEGGWASIAKMAVGDLILRVNNEKVKNVKDFKKIMEKLKREKKDIVFYIERGIHHLFVELRSVIWEERK